MYISPRYISPRRFALSIRSIATSIEVTNTKYAITTSDSPPYSTVYFNYDSKFDSNTKSNTITRIARLRLADHNTRSIGASLLFPPRSGGFFNAPPFPARLRLHCRGAKIPLRMIPMIIPILIPI